MSIGGPAAEVGGAPQAWHVLMLSGHEGVDTLFDYQLLLRREPSVAAPGVRSLLGLALDVRIELGVPSAAGAAHAPMGADGAAGQARWIHGIVSQAARLQPDERGCVYALRLRPWAWRASLRGQCRVWRARGVPDVLLDLLRSVQPPGARVQLRLQARYAPRDYLVQFNQTDWECFARLAQEWGVHFWFEHREGAHDLVLADHNGAFGQQPAPGWRELGVARPGERAEHECLHALRSGHRLTSQAWGGRDTDYTLRAPGLQASAGSTESGQRGPLREVFRWRGDHGAPLAAPEHGRAPVPAAGTPAPAAGTPAPPRGGVAHDAGHLAGMRLQQLTQHAGRVRAYGPVRGVAPGYRVLLRDHRLAANAQAWLVLHVRLLLRECGHEPPGLAQPFGDAVEQGAMEPAAMEQEPMAREPEVGPASGDAGRAWDFSLGDAAGLGAESVRGGWQLHATLLLQSASRTLRPDIDQGKARVGGVQATVVAHTDDAQVRPGAMHTDRLGRVRVRMPWDAEGDAASPSPAAEQRGRTRLAPGTTGWIRAVVPWAGRAMGQSFLPRIGQQLLVGFVDGDPERPLALGALYHAAQPPAWELPRSRALTGWHSGEFEPQDGQGAALGSSHLLLDDTSGAPQAQLACSHLDSSLAMGRLGRVERGPGRGRARGHGAELRTDGHALVHSARGMLLSTHARDACRGAAADARETLSHMRRAQRWHAASDGPSGAGGAAHAVASQLGRVLQPLGAEQAAPGESPGQTPCVLPNRDLLLGAAQGFAFVSDADVHLATATNLGVAAGAQLGLHSGGDYVASAGGTVRLLAHDLGVRLLAAAGPLHLHGCAGTLRSTAAGQLLLDSAGDMRLQGAQGVLLQGGASFLRMTGAGIEYGTPGRFVTRSASMTSPSATWL